jgi:hypothetical protein
MILPAISIREPWASMIAKGEKTIEVRSWSTQHRGKIILCASRKPAGPHAGNAFALAEVEDVRPMAPEDKEKTGGVYDPACFSWVLKNVQKFNQFPISGRLGIFKIDTKLKKSL